MRVGLRRTQGADRSLLRVWATSDDSALNPHRRHAEGKRVRLRHSEAGGRVDELPKAGVRGAGPLSVAWPSVSTRCFALLRPGVNLFCFTLSLHKLSRPSIYETCTMPAVLVPTARLSGSHTSPCRG